MHRTSNTFSVLQATAVVVTMAVILWSLGLPSLRFVQAAAVTSYSDTLSTSEPSVASNHTITFTTPSGVPNGGTVSIDLSAFSGTSSIAHTDIDVSVAGTGDLTVEASCTTQQTSAAFSGDTLVITFCSGNGASVSTNGTTTIEIGTNATSEATGTNQLVNPAGTTSYEIPLTTSAGDSGETRVAIVAVVTVSASVDTLLNFSVAGLASGQTVNGTTTGTTTTATTIEFGELSANTPITGGQELTVSTNAANGYTVTVTADGMLRAGGADIDGFANGNYTSSPTAWSAPTANVSDENTWGHWGLTSDDADIFAATETFVSASTTAVNVMTGSGPVQATTTRVGYTVEISSLQEASESYQAILTYVVTPVF